ncbi:hypothetical protein ACINK0_11380 [Deinococcus sp. VB343]|uniref:hypothetical protein n=1 Tax=Deinococcus sp. VB343 TaxID=3385567 RepID=UPI0039C929F9
MPETFAQLFAAAQSWWLTEESGPGLLFGIRMFTATLSLFASWAWLMLARTPIVESTWEECHRQRFRLVCYAVAVGLLLSCGYFLAGGVFESERTSSPHRLLVGNLAWSATFLPSILFAVYVRFMFTRKVAIKGRRIQKAREA